MSFRAVARSLGERGILTTSPGTTAHAFGERASAVFPGHAAGLRDAARAFDAVRYLVDNGVKIEDINLLYFKDFGFNFPGNSLIASRETIEKNPDLVKRMALGCARAFGPGVRVRGDAGSGDRDGGLLSGVRRRHDHTMPAPGPGQNHPQRVDVFNRPVAGLRR